MQFRSSPYAHTRRRAARAASFSRAVEPLEGRTLMAAGLVAAYAFDEAAGATAGDASGLGNAATVSNAAWAAGKHGTALSFNGVNAVATVADADSLDLSTGMTLEAWVNPAALSGFTTVVMKERAGGLDYSLYASDGTSKPPSAYVYRNTDVRVAGTSSLPLNTWSHLAATYDGANLNLYVNAALVRTTAVTGALTATTSPLRIGGNGVWGEYFNGLIDDVRVYNRALSAGEITTDMNTAVAPAVQDGSAPTVALTAPAAGATLGGGVTVTASASDDVGVAGVQFKLNGANLGAEDTTAPYSVLWDTTAGANGPYNLTAVARDAAGNVTTSQVVSVTVANTDTTAPTVGLTAPAAGATLAGNSTFTAAASDNVGVVGVQFLVDGTPVGAEDTAAPYSITWDSRAVADGSHSVSARARDAAGNATTSAAVTVTVANSVPAPVGGLVAAWGFNEGGGTNAADASGNGHAGAVSGATWAAGKFGGALSFNGTNSTVAVPDADSLDLTTGMTLEAWVNPAALSGWTTVLMKERSGGLAYTLYASNNTAKPPAGYIRLASDTSAAGTSALPLNAWSHLAFTYDGANLRLYVNGTQAGATAASGAITTSTGVLRIGGNSVWGEYFNGLIDEVRVYNRALSAAEIATDMSTAVAPPAPDNAAPTVALTAPADGATVSGGVTVTANASDDVGVAGVQFKLNGANLGAEDTAAPYSVVWNTAAVGNGPYQLTAVARDAAGHVTTSQIVSVTVANADTTAPTVNLTAPAAGATVGGTTTLAATASDDVGVAGVQFLVDGNPVGAEDTAAPYSFDWDSRGVADGNHSVSARARDAAGHLTVSTAVSVTVANSSSPATVGQWSSVVNWPVVAINQVLLGDGRILMWDGDPDTECIGSSSATVYNPANGQFTPVPVPWFTGQEDDIFCSAQTLLADGRVLVVGGHNCTKTTFGIRMTCIFDPVSMTWTRGPDMNYRRWYPTVTTLADGRALILGGSDVTTVDYVDVPEIYDPVTNTITQLGNARLAIPSYCFAYQNTDGRVIVTGSDEAKMPTYALDVATQTWSTVDSTVLDAGSGVMYRPGQFMKAGSSYLSAPADNGGATPSKATTYVLDTTGGTPVWQQTASMAFARTHLNLTLLPDGNVLATGGSSDIGGLTSYRGVLAAEMWSPATRTWTTLPDMAVSRMYHSTAVLLPDGRVIIAGGGRLGSAVDYLNAQVYSPAYLFKGARPTITSNPSTIQFGSSFFVGTPDAADVASVVLVRNTAVTHSDNMNQRYVPLAFQQAAGGLTVQAPADALHAPPGHYMLFVVNSKGVPSVAPIVRFPAGYEDAIPPTAPTNLSASATGAGTATLTWTAATDNHGVARYDVYRGTAANFPLTDANRVGSAASTTYADSGLAAGTYYYAVRAVDAAGNAGPGSNVAIVTVVTDVTAPTVALTAPAPGAAVQGVVTLAANAGDDVAVAGVQFLLDGVAIGAEDTAAPYSFAWNSATASNGSHTLAARARDAAGNVTTSSAVTVTVSNSGPSGLVAAWSFDDGAGTGAADSSGNGHVGAVSGATWVTAGAFGGALSFNGLNNTVTVADADDLDLTTGLTLEAWVNPAALTGWTTVLMKERSGGLAYTLYASDNTGRPPAGYVRLASDTSAAGTSALPLNAWSHVAVTYDSAALRMYVNGTLVGSRAVTGAITTSTGVLRIGGNSVWGEYFKGLIDEVRVYNRALSAAEVQTDMNRPIGVAAAPVTVAAVPPTSTGDPLATGQATSLLTTGG